MGWLVQVSLTLFAFYSHNGAMGCLAEDHNQKHQHQIHAHIQYLCTYHLMLWVPRCGLCGMQQFGASRGISFSADKDLANLVQQHLLVACQLSLNWLEARTFMLRSTQQNIHIKGESIATLYIHCCS